MSWQATSLRTAILTLGILAVSACTYNPLISNNHTTGSAAGVAVGAAAGAGSIALLGGTRPMIFLGGITGGAIGYYVTSLRYDASGIMQAGGNVYVLGDYIGIYIPSDRLFESNTAIFLPQAPPILDSASAVLQRKPDNNILISGNTSGFYRTRWEKKISEDRARAVAAYLWSSGIQQFKPDSNEMRKLNYVGYGNYYPIASDLTNNGIRMNSRIQITSFPCLDDLRDNGRKIDMNNIASLNQETPSNQKNRCGRGDGSCA